MASKRKGQSDIVVEVLVRNDVPSDQRAEFEEAVVEFLFGIDRPRPELLAELDRRGIDRNGFAALLRQEQLAVCPVPDARVFIPGPALLKLASAKGLRFDQGGSVHVEFEYNKAGTLNEPPNVLCMNVRVPKGLAGNLSDEMIGEIATGLFGDCQLPRQARDYLAARGVELTEVAGHVDSKFQQGQMPPTTRVSADVADRLTRFGFDVNQFGKFKVLQVADHS